jgi:hypothetical protein
VTTGGERSNARDRTDGSTGRPGPATLGLDALLEVQRRGLQAAGELVDRLVRAVDGPDTDAHGDGATAGHANGAGPAGRTAPHRPDPGHAGPGGDASHDPQDASGEAVDQIARAWADWVRRGLSVFDGAASGDPAAASGDPPVAGPPADPTAPASGRDVALDAGGAIGVVRLVALPDHSAAAASPAGPAVGSAEVWLHNRGTRDRTAVALHGGPLLGSDGTVLPPGVVDLLPALVDLPARSSRGITVSVRTGAAPGTYRGVVVLSGEPDAWIALEVAVSDHASRDDGDGDGDDGR